MTGSSTDRSANAGAQVREREPLGLREIGPYRICDFLGSGGMGAVYLGFDETLERYAAIKVLSRVSPRSVERFLAEARRQARLDHPNIVSVYGGGTADDGGEPLHYIAMKFIEGSTLQQLVDESGPLEPIHATQLILDAARGLYYVHSEGFVHRDVKPSNILVDIGDRALISDFGIARDDTSRGDTTGVFVGTWNYASPEQAAVRGRVDARADIYSLGLTWLFALTGRDPIEDARGPDERPHIDPAWPPAVRDTLHRMLQQEPEHRHASMLQCAEALAVALQKLRLGIDDETGDTEAGIRPTRSLGVVGRTGLVAAVAAGFALPGVVLLKGDTGSTPPVKAAVEAPLPSTPPTPAPAPIRPVDPLLVDIDQAGRELEWRIARLENVVAELAATGSLLSDRLMTSPDGDLLHEIRDLVRGRLGELDDTAIRIGNRSARRRLDDLAVQTLPRVAAKLRQLEEGPIEIDGVTYLFERSLITNVEYFGFLVALDEGRQAVVWEQLAPGGAATWVPFEVSRTFRRPRFVHALEPVVGVHRSGIESYARFAGRRLPTRDEWLAVMLPRLRELTSRDATAGVFECVLWDGEPHFAYLDHHLPRFRRRDSLRSSQEGYRLIRTDE